MSYRKVEVLTLSRNEIVYKNIRFNKVKQVLVMLLALLLPLTGVFFSKYGVDEDVYSYIANLSNPIYSPFVDNSGVSFVDSVGYEFEDKVLEFELPLASSELEVKSDCINIKVKESVFVAATESGIVSEVGETVDGIKFIKILHSKDIESVIENIDISGVVVATVVKKGDKLASAKVGELVVFKIFEKGNAVNNLALTNNVITWGS